MMRDNIIKKRMRADEVPSHKAPLVNRELQKLQGSNGVESSQNNDENPDWHENDLSGEYQNDAHTCPSCFKKFDRKAVYTSHVQACSDAKCREKDKSRKRKAKEETKTKQLLVFDENSNGSEANELPNDDGNVNKRKRKRTSKVKKEESEEKESSNSVDWNLDDEEEKKKLENIKKEIIEDEYKKSANSSANDLMNVSDIQEEAREDDDEDSSALVIDEKVDENPFKCPTCEKVFPTDDKLKYHLTTYHSRQKRFKCKMCEYQGYRKKDTINHLSYVHNVSADKDSLENYMESVMKAVDEESLAKQNELKKNQLKIKRKLAREKLKMNGIKVEEVPAPEVKLETVKMEVPEPPKIEFKVPQTTDSTPPPKPQKPRRKSLHTSILIPPETDTTDEAAVMKIPKMFIKTKSPQPGQSLLNISKYGKVVKRSSTGDTKEGNTQRPIRNRIKPVRQDFLYDLSDLLKKDADAHREQASQLGDKRELRKRAMSTSTRESPFFDDSLSPEVLSPTLPATSTKDEDDIPLVKFKDPRARRMSVFTPPTRPMYPTKPKVESAPTNPNSGAAYRMALKEFEGNRASLYESKFFWSICFEEPKKASTFVPMAAPALPVRSAASSILQKLSGKSETEQLCKSFDMIHMEHDLDIPESRAINLNPGQNGLMALALEEAGSQDVCVLQECSPESDDDDDEEEEEESGPSMPSSSTASDAEPKKTSANKKKRSRRSAEKRKLGGNGQRRLTVMQRLQENKIRKSREQLFKRLIMDRQNDDENPSPVYNLFSES
jgi:hypothetical protein